MKKSSVTIATVSVIVCMALVVAVGIAAPWLVKWFTEVRGLSKTVGRMIFSTYYVCAIQAEFALLWLYRLLRNIKKDKMFDRVNPYYMFYISNACLSISLCTFVVGFWYPPFFFVSAAMLFLFLIVRVVRLCFIAATEMKEENDLTI